MVYNVTQADVLARYKPTLNLTLLVPTLKQADKWTVDALKHFKSTRHIVLYYEDLVHNRTVSSLCSPNMMLVTLALEPALHLNCVLICSVAETEGRFRVPKGASEKASESPGENSQKAIV